MRIQHNIMAMNAYRNYNNNTSALSKNLEKLSSGYKINRAGDDAAGLAISEKMRAQITGLNAAQKNVKDGVSLVKTAEGAMQEIQDMLNRMDYLATQSANGTYDDPVDRNNLQKEVKALKEEINRIADSANFNGIKLLDGSLDKTVTDRTEALKAYEDAQKAADDAKAAAPNAKADLTETAKSATEIKGMLLPDDIGAAEKPLDVAGTKNIYQTDGAQGDKPKFSVQFDGLAHQVVGAGEKLTLTVGGQTVKDTNGNDIVIKKADGTAYGQGDKLTDEELAALFKGAKVKVGNVDYTVNATTGVDGTKITFEADAISLDAVNPHLDVALTPINGVTDGSVNNGKVAKYEFDLAGIVNTDTGNIDGVAVTYNTSAAQTASDFVATYNGTAGKEYTASADAAGKITLTAKTAGVKTDPTATLTIAANGPDAITATVAQAGENAGKTAGTAATFTIDISSVTAQAAVGTDSTIDGVDLAFDTDADGTGAKFVAAYNAAGKDYVASYDNGTDTITLTKRTTGEVAAANKPAIAGTFAGAVEDGVEGTDSTNVRADGTTGSINVGTVDIKYTPKDETGRLANTVLTLSNDLLKDGTKIKLGNETYTLALGDKSTFKTGGANAPTGAKDKIVEVSSADMTDVNKILSKLTQVAKDNDVFSVGQNADGKITLQQLDSAKTTTSMRNKDELASWIGVTTVAAGSDDEAVKAATKAAEALQKTADDLKAKADKLFDGSPLTLQIGDTSDSFNQMKVNVGDMHVDAMGTFVEKKDEDGNIVLDEDGNAVMELAADSSIEDIDISTQEGAHDAIDVIKNAINYVSGIRGDLGAIQNRLEHTQNNLSVMAENIQDAESTIRDTDVAEEMMSYVKNNILVQSAQAMLAQANQVPQGVLQLLG